MSSDSSTDEDSDGEVAPEIAFVNQHAEKTPDETSDDESTLEDVELKVFTCMICNGGYEDDEIATLCQTETTCFMVWNKSDKKNQGG